MKKLPNFSFRLFLMACLLAFPIAINAQTVSLSFKNVPLKTVLKSISAQTDCKFVYSESVINTAQNVSIEAKGEMPAILEQVFKGTGISYKVVDKQIVLSKEIKVQQTKKSKVSGLVTDEAGAPLPGVTVSDGHGTYSVTDGQGHYSIEVDPSSELTYACLGQETRSFQVSGRSTIDVVLGTDFQMLDNAIVTGYQTLSKERSAGSFSNVRGKEISSKASLTGSLLGSLEGLTTGLTVNNSAGATSKYLVRGLTSINSKTSPLFVVDGIPLDENLVEDMVNFNDVSSVTVLKDATASSIWGSQAGNGVVVITTKKGDISEKLNVSYNGSFTFCGMPDYSYKNAMDGKTFMKNAQELFDIYSQNYDYKYVQNYFAGITGVMSNSPVVFPHEDIMYQYKEGMISASERDSRLNALIANNEHQSYVDNFMSNKWLTTHSINLYGGGKRNTYYVSVGYTGNQGSNRERDNRFTLNTRQDFKLTDWLKWDVTLNASFGNVRANVNPWYQQVASIGDCSIIYYSSKSPYRDFPYMQYKSANGAATDIATLYMLPSKQQMIEQTTGVSCAFQPADDFSRSFQTKRSTNVRVNTGLEIKFLEGFKYEGRFQYSRSANSFEWYIPWENWIVREEYFDAWETAKGKSTLPSSGGHFRSSNGNSTDWTVRNQLTFDRQFGKHQIAAIAGTEVREYKYSNYNNFHRGYDYQTMKYAVYDQMPAYNGIMGALLGSSYNMFDTRYYTQGEVNNRYFSLFANAGYTYDGKYTVNASIRMDQSNLFGSDPANQYKPIWAVSAAWNMGKEEFMMNADAVNNLTIRASYGFAGNSPKPEMGGSYNILSTQSYPYFESIGYNITTPANKSLTWEKTRTVNVGIDVRLFGRLDFSADFYDKKTTDLLGVLKLDPVTGWATTTGNLGVLSNRGFEVSIMSRNITSGDFTWDTQLSLNYNDNKLVRYDVQSPITPSNIFNNYYIEGYPAGAMFAYKYAGLNDKGETQIYNSKGEIVSGSSAESSLTLDDLQYVGTYVPKWNVGFTNTLQYKGVELSFMFIFNGGHKMRKDCTTMFNGRPTGNLYNDFDKRWRQPGDEKTTNIPAYTAMYNQNNVIPFYYYADANVLSAAYVKLRDLRISYNIPASFARKMGMQGAKISFQMGNVFYIAANNDGIDPEYKILNGTSYSSRPDRYGASYSVGLNINF